MGGGPTLRRAIREPRRRSAELTLLPYFFVRFVLFAVIFSSMLEIIQALELPPQAMVHQRVAKKLLLENGAPTGADKRAITEGIDELTWAAALKPTTIGVPAYENAERQYLEIAVLTVAYREKARTRRLRELIHRAIPYPVVLIGSDGLLSLVELRHAQNETRKMVLDGELLAIDPAPILPKLALALQPTTDLAALYRAWYHLLLPMVRRAERLADIDALRREAAKELQLARRVELNLRIRQLSGGQE